jgi:hypothetical protein
MGLRGRLEVIEAEESIEGHGWGLKRELIGADPHPSGRFGGVCAAGSVMWRPLVMLPCRSAVLSAGQRIAQTLHLSGQHPDLLLLGGHHAVQVIEQILGQAEFFFEPGDAVQGLRFHGPCK